MEAAIGEGDMKRIFLVLIAVILLGYAFDPVAPFDVIKSVKNAGGGAMDTTDAAFQAYVANHTGAMTGAAIIDSIKDKKVEIDSAWTFKSTVVIHIQSSIPDSALVVIVDTGAGGGQAIAYSPIAIHGTGINSGTDYPLQIKNSAGNSIFYVSGVGRTYIDERLTVDDGIVDYDYLNVYGHTLLGNAAADTVGVMGKLKVQKNIYNVASGSTFTNCVLPTHPDSVPQFGYPGPTYIDTALVAIMATGMSAPIGYGQMFVDTTGTDSVIVMIGAVRLGFPIE